MSAKVFLDTNVLVYAALGTAKDDRKSERALVLIESEEFGTSAQVLQEFFVTVTRKAVRPLSVERALEWIQQLITFPCYPIDHRIVRIAIEQAERHRISYWDAAILSAAQAMGCQTVYSEDLNDGQEYSGVRVTNPFRTRQIR